MKFIRNRKFKAKIIILIAVITVFNGLVSGMLFSGYAASDTIENYCESSEDLVWQFNEYIGESLYGITRKVYALNSNLSFTEPMNKFLADPASVNKAVLMGDIAEEISELVNSNDLISYAFIHTRLGDFDNFINIRDQEALFENSEIYRYFEEHPKDGIAWFPASESYMYKTNEIIIPVGYRFAFGTDNIYVVVAISRNKLDEYVRDTLESYDHVYILDENNHAITGEDVGKELAEKIRWEELESENAKCEKITHNGEYMVTSSVVRSNGWRIIAVKNMDALTGNIRKLRLFVALSLAASTLVCIIFSVLMVRRMTKPLSELANVMKNAPRGGEDTSFHYEYNDEVGELASSFNLMIREINTHIEELAAEKEAKRVAELKALQAQINPHFLYNTLNAITWQAADMGATEISTLSNSLGKFFRLSLNHGKELIALADEFEHTRSYLEIQKIRYKSKFEYRLDLKDYLKDLIIIKLVIQPLVENSIYHGIKELDRNGMVTVSAERLLSDTGTPIIRIIVDDDGKGIPAEHLSVINGLLKEGKSDGNTGYGIFNVNERIKLYYGAEYGLFLESVEDRYTRAILTIPEVKAGA